MIDRRTALTGIGGTLALLPATRRASAAGPRRIAYLHPAVPNPAAQGFVEVWRKSLLGLGWIEGQTIAIEQHWAHGDVERLRRLAAEVVGGQVDLIQAIGHAVFPVADQTKSIPIVAVNLESDPVTDKLVASLGRPGGNVTGLFLNAPELSIKHLQILKETAPGMERVAVISQPRVSEHQLAAVLAAGRQLGLTLTPVPFSGPQDIEACFASMTAAKVQGLLVLPSPTVNGESRALAGLAARARVPSISMFRAFAEYGGLIHYGPKLAAMFERAAFTCDRILRGSKPAELPVEQPTAFEFVVNLKTATALGLSLPPGMLVRADEVIE